MTCHFYLILSRDSHNSYTHIVCYPGCVRSSTMNTAFCLLYPPTIALDCFGRTVTSESLHILAIPEYTQTPNSPRRIICHSAQSLSVSSAIQCPSNATLLCGKLLNNNQCLYYIHVCVNREQHVHTLNMSYLLVA